MTKRRGFTLVELMIVVSVIAVLALLALSSYNKQLRKSRRAEAKQVLADYALREEKWRNNNATYGTLANINGATPTSSGNYSIAITFPTGSSNCASGLAQGNANSFIITAATVAGGRQAKDTGCATMVLTNDCGNVAKTSTGGATDCW